MVSGLRMAAPVLRTKTEHPPTCSRQEEFFLMRICDEREGLRSEIAPSIETPESSFNRRIIERA